MTDNRRYIDTEPGWRFSLRDSCAMTIIVGFVVVALGVAWRIRFDYIDKNVEWFFLLLWVFVEAAATLAALRWVWHSQRWLENNEAAMSRMNTLWLYTSAVWLAWMVGLSAYVLWAGLMFLIYMALENILKAKISDGNALLIFVTNGCIYLWCVYGMFQHYWRLYRPQVGIPPPSTPPTEQHSEQGDSFQGKERATIRFRQTLFDFRLAESTPND